MLEDPEGSSDPPSFRLQPALGFPHRKHGTEDRHLKFYELWDNLGVSRFQAWVHSVRCLVSQLAPIIHG